MTEIVEDTLLFTETLYENDKEAKERFKLFFDQELDIFYNFYELVEMKENKKNDGLLKRKSDGKLFKIELEMRNKNAFNKIVEKIFPTIHIPYRKIKNKNDSDKYFIMGKNDEFHVILIDTKDIFAAFENKEYETRISSDGNGGKREDTFVNISYNKATILYIDKNKKKAYPINKVRYVDGDIFDLDVEYIAHQCNCLTSNSAGFANKVFTRYPEADIYKTRNKNTTVKDLPKEQKPSQIIVREKVINMLSQVFPGKPRFEDGIDSRTNRLVYFRKCLEDISLIKDIKSVAFPHGIGCNMGGGKWEDYKKEIENFAQRNYKVQVFVANPIKNT